MSIVGKKKVVRKELQNNPEIKLVPRKTIGLDEQIHEAKRLYRLIENPEILRAR